MDLPKSIIIISLFLGLSWGVLSVLEARSVNNDHLYLNGRIIQLEFARTPAEQYQGLSDHDDLCPTCGMLFSYDAPRSLTFVMRRMHFPLDIVWVREKKVVGVAKNLPPESTEPYTLYNSPEAADTVLELPAGQAAFYNLETGKPFLITSYGTAQ